MKGTIKETVRETLEIFGSNDSTTTVAEIVEITGFTDRQVWGAIQRLDDGGMVEKIGNVRNRRYQYIGPKVEDMGTLKSNQEGFSLPLIKLALSNMSVNTAVHIGWKTSAGKVFCLCGSNDVARKRANEDSFDPDNWNEVSHEKYKNVTCKKCIESWYANRTRMGDELSAQDYVREKIRRNHIERKNRSDYKPSTKSEPIPLDENMVDEPMMKTKKRVVTIRFDDVAESETEKVNDITKEDLGDGVIFNTQIKMVKLKHLPNGEKAAAYKCRFCCFNGLRPCPRASLDKGEKRFLCYEAGPDYYFIEVLSKQG